MNEFNEDDELEKTENVMNFYKRQEVKEVEEGVEKMLTLEIPYTEYEDVDYNPDTRVLLVNVKVQGSEVKKARNLGKLSEVKTMINRAIGGAISPFILSNNVRLIIVMKYRRFIFNNKERILDCEIHNKRFDFMKHAGT